MAGNWGNNKLYNMGLDEACIGTLRKLSPEQVNQLVEILNELRLKEEKLWKKATLWHEKGVQYGWKESTRTYFSWKW